MHESWCAAGFDPDRFWGQTPASFGSAMRGSVVRAKREAERDLAHAHTSAAFGRATKLKPLDQYLPRHEPRRSGAKPITMLDKLRRIAAATKA